jgi:hypothetical protein
MLIHALVVFVVVILVLYLVNMLPVDGRAKQIIQIIVIIIGILSLLQSLGYGI